VSEGGWRLRVELASANSRVIFAFCLCFGLQSTGNLRWPQSFNNGVSVGQTSGILIAYE
jgi:hypothetical protein